MKKNYSQLNYFTIYNAWYIRYTGEDGESSIYLSVLGEVYDVTLGKEFYQQGSGYSYFAGRDATIGFFAGELTEEMKDKKALDYEGHEIMAMYEWRTFYEEHEEYQFVGVLDGDYYDSEGKETPYLVEVREKAFVAKKQAEEKQKERDAALKKRRQERLAAEAKRKADEAEKAKNELWVSFYAQLGNKI